MNLTIRAKFFNGGKLWIKMKHDSFDHEHWCAQYVYCK